MLHEILVGFCLTIYHNADYMHFNGFYYKDTLKMKKNQVVVGQEL